MITQITADASLAAKDASTSRTSAINLDIAGRLRDYADLLTSPGEGGFRSRAYRRAADVVAGLDRPIDDILAHEGRAGLIALPAVGVGIAGAIADDRTLVATRQAAR